MAQKVTAAVHGRLVVGDGFTIRFRAVSPTDGTDVTGVVVSNVNVDGDDAGSGNVTVSNPILIGVNT